MVLEVEALMDDGQRYRDQSSQPDDMSTAEELLAIGMRAVQDGRPAPRTDHRGESDGEP
jgi:hypothetical protein